MPYAFRTGEPPSLAVPRIMREQLDRIEEHLRARDVHEARKRMKEIRALLKLARRSLGAQFEIENFWYRDRGRELAPARDAEAALETLDKLPDAARVRPMLKARLAAVDVQPQIDAVLAAIPQARARIAAWPTITSIDPKRSRRAARRAYEAARHIPVAPRFHELRKRVKDCWYQRRLLGKKTKKIERLSDALGDDHDLHMLELAVDDAALRDAAVTQRLRLERESLKLARSLFTAPTA